MDKKSKISSFPFYLLVTLGLMNLTFSGIWVYSIATLREAMQTSNSPMVGAPPFFNVAFIFVAAWLSYAFLGGAIAHKRKTALSTLGLLGLTI